MIPGSPVEPKLLRHRVRSGERTSWEALLVCEGRVPREVMIHVDGATYVGRFWLRKRRFFRRGEMWRLEADLPGSFESKNKIATHVKFTDGTSYSWGGAVPVTGLDLSWDVPSEETVVGTLLTISGWVVRPHAPPTRVECRVDGVTVALVTLDVARPDVRATLRDVPSDLVGFHQHIQVKALLTGCRSVVSLHLTFQDGVQHLIRRSVVRLPFMSEEEHQRVHDLVEKGATMDGWVGPLTHSDLSSVTPLPQIIAFCRLDPFWRTGFAEWRRVLQSEPRFLGHEQPNLPLNGQFEDCSARKTLESWAELMKNYGVAALCVEVSRADDPWVSEWLDNIEVPYCFRWLGEGPVPWERFQPHVASPQYFHWKGQALVVGGVAADDVPLGVLWVAEHQLSHQAVEETMRIPATMDPLWRGRCVEGQVGVAAREKIPVVRVAYDTEPSAPYRGTIQLRTSVESYQNQLWRACESTLQNTGLIFVESWNHWLESSQLEPDHRRGFARLQATRDVLEELLPAPLGSSPPPSKLAVVLHLYYRDLWEEIAQYLKEIAVPFQLHVSVTGGISRGITRRIMSQFPGAVVHELENLGRDVLPFFQIVPQLIDSGVEIVLKLHSKKSVHRADGLQWRQDLYGKLTDHAARFLDEFAREPKLGMIGPAGHLLQTNYFVGSNQLRMEALAELCGKRKDLWCDSTFFAGTMFWARVEALRPLLKLWPQSVAFEAEAGQTDGTLGHAVERMMLPLLLADQWKARDTDGKPVSTGSRTYDHAGNG